LNQYTCHTCDLKIDGQYILLSETGNLAYHPECFLCQACGKPIGGAFEFHQDQPYHTICLYLLLDLRCPACGGLISGRAIEALDHKWHPEHFVCMNCQKPLQETQYRQEEGKPYCETCYQSLFMLNCDICSRPITGKAVRNAWGDLYCSLHVYDFRECSCCRRPICPQITGGGSMTTDGRSICNLCRKTAVNRLNQAWPAFVKVQRYLSQLGLDLIHTPLSLELVDRNKLVSHSSRRQSAGSLTGMLADALMPVTGKTAPDPGEKIQILNGLPWELFTAISACELGHAWLHMKKDHMLISASEQDFCKSLGRRWLESLGTPTSEVWANLLQESGAHQYSKGDWVTL
jgi:hypothetical protein